MKYVILIIMCNEILLLIILILILIMKMCINVTMYNINEIMY